MNADAPIIVSHHTVKRARMRFGEPHLKWQQIQNEVRAALQAGRVGKRLPTTSRDQNKTRAKNGVRFCWTPDNRRCYAIAEHRSSLQRNLGKKIIVVVTAFPIDSPKPVAA